MSTVVACAPEPRPPAPPRESERLLAMGAVAAGLAHDFNNLLLAIQGFSGLAKALLRAGGETERVLSYVDEIETAGQRAQLLVRQVAALAREGEPWLDAAACVGVGREVAAAFAGSVADTVAIVVAIDDELPPIAVDRSHLHRIWANLCRNACQAMGDAGTVVLSARRAGVVEGERCAACHSGFGGDFVRLAVSDEGHGIAGAIRDRIFEPFFSCDQRGSRLGLGLTAVAALVHHYGGHMQVVDRAAGGTEVAAFLPSSGERPAATADRG